jgi:hypothetical protein
VRISERSTGDPADSCVEWEWPMERSAFKMGFYGAGAMWCLREPGGTYITFNNVRIARREEDGTWRALEPGWKIAPVGTVAVRIQRNDEKSVIMPFRGGR